MKVFIVKAKNGGVQMTDYQRATWTQILKDNEGARIRITIEKQQPESKNQRKFYHGAVLPLWAYLDGKDYRDANLLETLHEVAKREFNGEWLEIAGKLEKVGKSTKGALQGYIDRVIDFIEEQYGVDRSQVLNPEHYKRFRDVVYGYGEIDTYIDYLKSLHIL